MTKATNTERIRDLESKLGEALQEITRLRELATIGRAPFQNVRIIKNGFIGGVSRDSTNHVFKFQDVDDHLTTPTLTDRSSASNHNVWKLPGHEFVAGERAKVVFFYNGLWHEFPITPTAGLFITSADIPAATATVMGSGSGVRQRIEDDGTLSALSDTVTLWNTASEKVTGSKLVHAKQDIEGRWLVDFEDCD